MAENLEQKLQAAEFDTQHAVKLSSELLHGNDDIKPKKFSEAVDYLLSTRIFEKADLIASGPNQLTQALILAYAVTKFIEDHKEYIPSSKLDDLERLMELVKSDQLEKQVRLYQETSDLSTLYHGVIVGAKLPNDGPKRAEPVRVTGVPQDIAEKPEVKNVKKYLTGMKNPEDLQTYLLDFNNTPSQRLDCIGEHLAGLLGVLNNVSDEIHSAKDLSRVLNTIQILTRPMLVSGVDGMKDAYKTHFENPNNVMAQYMMKNFGVDRSTLSNPIEVAKHLRAKLTDRKFDDMTMEFAVQGTSALYADTLRNLYEMVHAAEMADSMKDNDWRTAINSG